MDNDNDEEYYDDNGKFFKHKKVNQLCSPLTKLSSSEEKETQVMSKFRYKKVLHFKHASHIHFKDFTFESFTVTRQKRHGTMVVSSKYGMMRIIVQ